MTKRYDSETQGKSISGIAILAVLLFALAWFPAQGATKQDRLEEVDSCILLLQERKILQKDRFATIKEVSISLTGKVTWLRDIFS